MIEKINDIIETFRLCSVPTQKRLVIAIGAACNEILMEFGVESPQYRDAVGIHDVMREIYESR